jgi:hypothetical protein
VSNLAELSLIFIVVFPLLRMFVKAPVKLPAAILLSSHLPTTALKSIDDLIGLQEETINRIRALAVIRPEFSATIS